MLGSQIREARQQAGFSQEELARRSGLHRTQVQKLEEDANITLETLRKILSQLPNLKVITLGPVAVNSGVDSEDFRRTVEDMVAQGRSVLLMLEAAKRAAAEAKAAAAAVTPPPAPPPPVRQVESELEARLRRLEAALYAGSLPPRTEL
jgi:transcriptional regulator with XRE-family HTH domain